MLDKRPETIRRMFAEVAPRYDLANRVLSMRFDVLWRRHVARRLIPVPGLVLDLAAGTGDLTVDLTRHGRHRVVAADFTFEMLAEGRDKLRKGAPEAVAACADALALPFGDASFDAVTVAFGIRNFADPAAGLREIHRVLRPGGAAGILEFSMPRQPLKAGYYFYFKRLLPLIGGLVTGSRQPYEYLPASVERFPYGAAFEQLMRESGFRAVTAKRLTGGIATFYRGEK